MAHVRLRLYRQTASASAFWLEYGKLPTILATRGRLPPGILNCHSRKDLRDHPSESYTNL